MNKSPTVKFSGFSDQSLKYLKALGFHQNREWFHENKQLYEDVIKRPMGDLVEAASSRFADMGIPLHGTRKTTMFKVNRDVRFSKNKEPYNTHSSAVLTRSGAKKDGGGAYMHFKNDNCFFAAGIWFPEPNELRALREMIIQRRDDFLQIEKDLADKDLVFDTSEALKRVPPAFKYIDDPDLQRLLKQKSFTVDVKINDTDIQKPELLNTFVHLAKNAMPLMEFCWRAMDPVRELNDG